MKAITFDTSRYDQMIDVMEGVYHHKLERGAETSDVLFYRLLADYHRRVRQAHEAGKLVVGHTVMVPTEIFYAMDIVPLQTDNGVNTTITTLKNQEEIFSIAKGLGMAPELCSAHRAQMAMYVKGWFPRTDGVIYSHQVCDSSPKSGEDLCHVYDIPGFYLDRPYSYRERDAEYYAQEMEQAIAFLEKLSGRPMDWDRLLQALHFTRQAMDLQKEVYELRRASPSPMANRRGPQSMNIGWLYGGSREAVEYFTVLRDELKARVAQGKGFIPQEQFRLMCIFPPPPIEWKMLDWMEKSMGLPLWLIPFTSTGESGR